MLISWLNFRGLDKIGVRDHAFSASRYDLLDIAKYKFGIFGVLLVMMLFRPEGLHPELAAEGRIRRGREALRPLRRAGVMSGERRPRHSRGHSGAQGVRRPRSP